MVPVDGQRVRDALEWWSLQKRGQSFTSRAAAEALTKQLNKRAENPVRYSAIDRIVGGGQGRCHRSFRDAIARLVGRPVTSEFLGGEENLSLSPLVCPPSGTGWALPLPIGMIGDPAISASVHMPPRHELEAWRLGREITAAAVMQALPVDSVRHPDSKNAARWLLSLAFWREALFEGQSHGASGEKMREQSGLFAYHLGQALRILFEPWFRGRVAIRRNVLSHAGSLLDQVAMSNEQVHQLRQEGRLADLAVRDALFGRAELASQFSEYVATRRRQGANEAQIATELLSWEEAEGVPE